jgi:hypothetical protein
MNTFITKASAVKTVIIPCNYTIPKNTVLVKQTLIQLFNEDFCLQKKAPNKWSVVTTRLYVKGKVVPLLN